MLEAILGKIPARAARSVSLVSLHKVVQVMGMVLTVALAPRLLGAEAYGRFSFILSLSYLGQILGDFGTLDVMGRFVPGMSPGEARRLYMRTLAYKAGVGAACGALTAAAALWLGDWMAPSWAIMAGLGVALHVVGWVPFQFALGLNRVGTWMVEQAWRQWVVLGLLLVLFPLLGLTGALLALLAMELIFCWLGLWWVRDYWRIAQLRLEWPYLRPYLAAGLGFFLANLTAVALYRSGPVLVEVITGDSVQAGYLNLALGLFLMAYVSLSQFAQGLVPSLRDFLIQGRPEQMRLWLRNFVRYTWLLAWLGTALVWAAADWGAPLLFGREFGPAAEPLKWISLGIPATGLLWAGNVAATVTGRGRVKFAASLAALLTFLLAGLALIPTYGATGAALGLSLAVAANVLVLSLGVRPDFTYHWLALWPGMAVGGLSLAVLLWFG